MINTTAGSYIWDNVANYDYTFRQLISTYPRRSWAKIYNQMWNIAMHDPIPRQNQNNTGNSIFSGKHQNYAASQGQQSQNNSGDEKRRPNYCWTFNKGQCKDPKCRFVNRCSYCDSGEHGIHACAKAKKAGVTLVTQPQSKS